MGSKRFLTILVLAVLSITWSLLLFAASTIAATPTEKERWAKVNQQRSRKITHQMRLDAAKRAKSLKLSPTAAAVGPIAPSRAPGPGETPRYFGPEPNWAFSPKIRKFMDGLPGLTSANANNLGQYIPVGNPDTITYPGSDYYEIGLVQYSEQMHRDLPPTTLRGYVQLNNGTDANGNNTIAPDPVHYLGVTIVSKKDRPVRIKFTNMLPTGEAGDLFIPVDTSLMGAGAGPVMSEDYTQNRATLHLHGGRTPWISDGTPHQWTTPKDEATPYPKGVSVRNVPDMPDPGPGSLTFFYTNQQSARLMFYHDHAYGITRLNVYVGEAAGYVVTDDVEKELTDAGLIPADPIYLIIQDKTFVDATTITETDPTWAWGTTPGTPNTGDLWMPHVYMTAQNPYDITGTNPFGRWHYGPWFWPPTTGILHGPVPNPYANPANPLYSPSEPPEIPGVPHPSMGMESFFDTPLVNGTAYPTLTVEPKSYRFRILNAANDRFFNLQMYVADPAVTTSDNRTNTEVKMVPAVPGLPDNWATDGREGGVPDPTTAGPDWIQIGTEGGFLPMPAVIPSQPIQWNLDPTTFNFGNVSEKSLLLGCAERADVIVDFSAYAGQTLILYNDAPAAFPALDPRYDYYTGSPDLTEIGGVAGTEAGFGPNTRTIMQIKVEGAAAPPFNLTALETAFKSTASQAGVFERGQDPIIVGQTAYNEALNKVFPTMFPNWGLSRIQDNYIGFQTVNDTFLNLYMEPKAIQDEMGEAFDTDYGRMSGKLGLEKPLTVAGNQNFMLYGYIDKPTEIISASQVEGAPVAGDGTQIWKITHNGVDTHPVHFHLFDVQLINRVGWDGAIRLPDANELGWKETVRISPLEDTIVALKAVKPKTPFGIPDSVRLLNPAMPLGDATGFSSLDPVTGEAVIPAVTNQYFNFGWEYVWHCHILSHEEMDMMRPVVFIAPRLLPPTFGLNVLRVGGSNVLTWNDPTPPSDPSTNGNPANEVGYRIERAPASGGGIFAPIGTALANAITFSDTITSAPYYYRVIAFNAAGETVSNTVTTGPPLAPTNLTAQLPFDNRVNLSWTDNATNESNYEVMRATNIGFTLNRVRFTGLPVNSIGFSDNTVQPATMYYYRVRCNNSAGASAWSNTVSISTPGLTIPVAPSNLTLDPEDPGHVRISWIDNSNNENGFDLLRSTNAGFTLNRVRFNIGANLQEYLDTTATSGVTYFYKIRAYNSLGYSAYSNLPNQAPSIVAP